MDTRPKPNGKLNPAETTLLLAYAYAGDSPAFLELLRTMYRSCRKKAQEAFEKSDSTAAYWTGRADTYENLIDNCLDAQKARLKT